jgi:hypothetical protein
VAIDRDGGVRGRSPEPVHHQEAVRTTESAVPNDIVDLADQVAGRGPVGGRQVFEAVLDARTEDGTADWLSSDDGMSGWRPTGRSWSEVQTSAGKAGHGGLAVFPPEVDTVRFVHHGDDGALRVVEINSDGQHGVFDFDRYTETHDAPVSVIAIGRDGVVPGKSVAKVEPTRQHTHSDDSAALQDIADLAGEVPGRMPLPHDVQLITDLTAFAVEDRPTTGAELLKSVFDQRFALGVRLKGSTGSAVGARTGSDWLFAGTTGWQAARTWGDVEIATGLAGTGGLTLFAPADGHDVATFVHNARDGVQRVIEVDLHGNRHVTPLDEYRRTHPVPERVASIDHCAEVHV